MTKFEAHDELYQAINDYPYLFAIFINDARLPRSALFEHGDLGGERLVMLSYSSTVSNMLKVLHERCFETKIDRYTSPGEFDNAAVEWMRRVRCDKSITDVSWLRASSPVYNYLRDLCTSCNRWESQLPMFEDYKEFKELFGFEFNDARYMMYSILLRRM